MMFLILPFHALGHIVELVDKSAEEIINERKKIMSTINKLSQKIYKKLNSSDLVFFKKKTLELKHSASEFKNYFPKNSKGGKAKNEIWENKILFEEYNNNFISDINLMLIGIDENNIKSLKESFNNMSSNCGTCHKKFKNKK